jgi:hypothetical protein
VYRVLPGRRVRPKQGMLSEFVSLSALSETEFPRQVLAYARRWGVLEICDHGLPRSHTSGCRPREAEVPEPPDGEMAGDWMVFREPLLAWRVFANEAATILSLRDELRAGKTGSPEELQVLGRTLDRSGLPARDDWTIGYLEQRRADADERSLQDRPARADALRSLLAVALNRWQRLGDVRPQLIWRRGRQSPEEQVVGSGLFGALARALLQATVRQHGLAVCSSCGREYVPRRQPSPKRRRYCPTCTADGAPRRDADRDFKQRRNQS